MDSESKFPATGPGNSPSEHSGQLAFTATWFDGRSSRALPVRVSVEEGWLIIRDAGENVLQTIRPHRVKIDPAIASGARRIRFPNNGLIETDDLAAADSLEAALNVNSAGRIVQLIEGSWGWILALAVAAACFLAALFIYGLPIGAKIVAFQIPQEIREHAAITTMEFLDDSYFEPTELGDDEVARIQALFTTAVDALGTEPGYRLETRQSDAMGANAFAMPSGLIVATDELVLLLNDDELMGIFAHEIGHVEEQHGMRLVIQNSGIFLILGALLGDIGSVTGVAGALPTLLLSSGYSRKFESDADEFAGHYMMEYCGGTDPLQSAMEKLLDASDGIAIPYLSSHPETEDRIDALEELEGKEEISESIRS